MAIITWCIPSGGLAYDRISEMTDCLSFAIFFFISSIWSNFCLSVFPGFSSGFPVLGAIFWRFLGEISDLDVNLRRPRTTSGGQILVRCSPNTSLPNETFRFPIPPLGKFPGRFPQNSHFYNGMPIPRPFLYYFFTF